MRGRSSNAGMVSAMLRRLAPSVGLSSLPLVGVAVVAGLVPAGANGQDAGAAPVTPRPLVAGAPAAGAEIKDLRTSHTRTFEDPSGLQRMRVYPSPVHFRNAEGRWQSIENRLVRTEDGLTNAAGPVDVELPEDVASGVSVAKGEHSISFAPVGAQGSPSAKGPVAKYEDVMPGVDLRYTALSDGLKEDIVVQGPEAPETFAFDVRTSPGLGAREDGANGVTFENAEGRAVASMPAPFMTAAEGEDEGFSDDVDLDLQPTEAGYRLTLRPDAEWLRVELRDGPVVIDPTTTYPANSDCKIANGSTADQEYCSGSHLSLGSSHEGASIRKRRSLLRFTVGRWLPQGSEIYSATLNLESFKRTTTNPISVDVHDVSAAWDRPTWNRRTASSLWAAPGGDYAPAVVDTAQIGDTLGWESWDVTASMQRWADGAASGKNDGGQGFLLKQSDENVVANDLDLYDSDAAGGQPYMDLIYDNLTGELPYYAFEQDERLTDRLSMKENVATGNLLVREDDLFVKGTLLDLGISRYYNGREPGTGSLGWGWDHTTGDYLRLSGSPSGDLMFHGPSGYVKAFRRRPDGSYVKPQGVNATLTRNAPGSGFTMKWNESDNVWRFDQYGYLVEQADRNGNKITLTYTDFDLTQITDTQGRITHFAYNAGGYITKMTDSAGREHHYAYNEGDQTDGTQLTSYTDPAGKVTRYEYSPDRYNDGQLAKITDPAGKVTSFSYDNDRRITSVTRGGHRTDYKYAQSGTPCGDLQNTVITDPRGNSTTHCWDNRGKVEEVHDALGRKRSTGFDSRSNVIQTQGPGGGAGGYSTNGTYDSNDNLTAVQQPGSGGNTGARTEFTYGTGSEAFKLKGSTDSQGGKRDYAYDGAGDLTRIGTTTSSGAAEDQVKLQYNGKADGDCADQSGRPKGTIRCSIDGNGNRTLYEHDTAGNLTKVIPPAPLGAITYTYDNLSRPVTMTDGKGQKRSFTYDARDRVTKVEFRKSGGALESTVNYAYDGDGNLVSRGDATGQTTFAYDSRNNLAEESFPGATSNRYAYDPAGNLQSFIDPAGTVLYAYNKVNLLERLTEPGGAQTTYGYNDDDSRTRTSFPNGVTETRTYDRGERPKSIRATNASGAVLTDFGYDYLRTGTSSESDLIQRMTDGERGTSTTYGYDHLSRLTSQNTTGSVTESFGYEYDANSNRVRSTEPSAGTRSYAYNAANQLCWVGAGTPTRNCAAAPTGSTTYQWDANGNLTYSSDGYAFSYNAQNQTTSLTAPGQATQQMGFLDTGQTDLVQRGPTGYLNNALAEGQSIGRRGGDEYTRHNGGLLQSMKNASGRHYYLTDAHPGSVAAMTNSAGNVAVRYRYGPFGDDRGQIGSLGNSLRFASQEYMPALGITKMGERFYLPKIGRWTQQDPLNQALDPRQANRYVYAGADSVNLADPSGELIPAIAAAAVGAAARYAGAQIARATAGSATGRALGYAGSRAAGRMRVGACWVTVDH